MTIQLTLFTDYNVVINEDIVYEPEPEEIIFSDYCTTCDKPCNALPCKQDSCPY